ncbi:hypothetical protein EJ08DRAFT_694141 [Tothia fuscella]|uniref:UDENN FLCN/SMCR8-type domain-containing protein n=1 Tax=Tothia fuscella TaxID=1048955 RepID=A0A9P4U1M9_9PEZI|nr:hypothetical protein EJ08DRAFT_694141 [Tothia fuscella]
MEFIISLAHFCEAHGPTSILCTQLNPVNCHNCFPCPTPPATEEIPQAASLPNSFWDPPTTIRTGLPTVSEPLLYSPFNSPTKGSPPPEGKDTWDPFFPASYSPPSQGSTSGSGDSISRFSVSSDSDCDSCDNCNFLIPPDMSKRLPNGAPGSPRSDGKGRHGSPILRTSQTILTQGRCDEEEEEEEEPAIEEQSTNGKDIPKNPEEIADPLQDVPSPGSATHSSGSARSFRSHSSGSTHTHNLQYVTTRQPSAPSSYSLLRRSCIRTLSCESLPRGSHSGPLYFGDPVAGYTIAYIFRLPDPRARGRRRMYALIALGGRDSWRVSTAYVQITKAFESIASQIVALADAVLEKEAASRPTTSTSTSNSGFTTPPLSSSLPASSMAIPQSSSPEKERAKSATTSPTQGTAGSGGQSRILDVSSFLSARRVDPDGFPRVSRDIMRAKGLAEIVGKDNFFVELHAKFCLILAELVSEGLKGR